MVLHDVITDKELIVFEDHTDTISHIQSKNKIKILVTGSYNGEIIIYDINDIGNF